MNTGGDVGGKGVTYDFVVGAVPDIARCVLAVAAAVSLARDAAAVAGRKNCVAIGTSLEGSGVEVVGHGERASGEDGEDGEGEELHFEFSFWSVWNGSLDKCVELLVVSVLFFDDVGVNGVCDQGREVSSSVFIYTR